MSYDRKILRRACKRLTRFAGDALAEALYQDAQNNADAAQALRQTAERLEAVLRGYGAMLDKLAAPPAQSVPVPAMKAAPKRPEPTLDDVLDALRDELPKLDTRAETTQLCLRALEPLVQAGQGGRQFAATLLEGYTWAPAAVPLAQSIIAFLRK